METALRSEKSPKHIAALLESFETSIACHDHSDDEVLVNQLCRALESAYWTPSPLTCSPSFSLAIWASPIVDSKDARLMAIYTSAEDLERGRRTSWKAGQIAQENCTHGNGC